uniref:Uncharacterized protein n=1 Tax=Panagrolaimus sp. PS1159 TaxID=55785 RepID=A0AC35F4Y7_9BILA
MEKSLSTKSYTFKNPRPQNFPFPSGVIYYITKFSSSIEGHQKLQKTCKYFYGKNQILVFNSLIWSKDYAKWTTKKDFIIETEKISYKIWLYKCLNIEGSINKNVVGFLTEKIYYCDIYSLTVKDQNIGFNEYKFLTSSGKIQLLSFENITVKYDSNDDDEIVPFENIIEQLPNLVGLTCVYNNNFVKHFTLKTAQNLVKFPIFKHLKGCIIGGIPELLNIEYFCDFVKQKSNDDDEIVPFENIIEQLPNLVGLTCVYKNNFEKHFTLKTAQNLFKLPIFKHLKGCIIDGIPELLNIEYFCDFVKKHEANYLLRFLSTVSNGYKKEFRSVLAKNLIVYQKLSRTHIRIITNQKSLTAKILPNFA